MRVEIRHISSRLEAVKPSFPKWMLPFCVLKTEKQLARQMEGITENGMDQRQAQGTEAWMGI